MLEEGRRERKNSSHLLSRPFRRLVNEAKRRGGGGDESKSRMGLEEGSQSRKEESLPSHSEECLLTRAADGQSRQFRYDDEEGGIYVKSRVFKETFILSLSPPPLSLFLRLRLRPSEPHQRRQRKNSGVGSETISSSCFVSSFEGP